VIDGLSGRSFTIDIMLNYGNIVTIDDEDRFVKILWSEFDACKHMPSGVWNAYMTSSFYQNGFDTWRNPCLISIDFDKMHWVWEIGAAVSAVLESKDIKELLHAIPATVTVNYSLKDVLDMRHTHCGEPSMIYRWAGNGSCGDRTDI
jgi:hypothetical protein